LGNVQSVGEISPEIAKFFCSGAVLYCGENGFGKTHKNKQEQRNIFVIIKTEKFQYFFEKYLQK